MNKTNISYLTHTWNPIAMRCSRISEACKNCWHLAMADRLAKNPTISDEKRAAYAGTGPPVFDFNEIDAPLRLNKPSVIGVQFMGDVFHSLVDYTWFESIMFKAYEAPQHTYIFLTKRSKNCKVFMNHFVEKWKDNLGAPFKNVIGMVTVENQEMAENRIPDLLTSPFAVRGVSVEPMLGEMNLNEYLCGWESFNVGKKLEWEINHGVDWVVCGGESGSGARPMNPEWPRSLRDQCVASGVPFMFKQWGRFCAPDQMPPDTFMAWDYQHGTEGWNRDEWDRFPVGKNKSGRLLDGELWDQLPF
jgi:protein gp37